MEPILTNEELYVGLFDPLKMNQMRFDRQIKLMKESLKNRPSAFEY